MKNLFLVTICFAMCGAMVASADTGVIAKSDIETIVDVCMADMFADAVNQVSFISMAATFDSANTIHSINLPEAVAYELAEDVGWRHEYDDYRFIATVDHSIEALLEHRQQSDEAELATYCDKFFVGIAVLDTDLSFRKARDGLSC
jgi:hypothetical protein